MSVQGLELAYGGIGLRVQWSYCRNHVIPVGRCVAMGSRECFG